MKKLILLLSIIISVLFVNAQTPIQIEVVKVNGVNASGTILLNVKYILYAKKIYSNQDLVYIKYINPNKQGFSYYLCASKFNDFLSMCNSLQGTLLDLTSVSTYKNEEVRTAINVEYTSSVFKNLNKSVSAQSVATLDCKNGSEKLFIKESPSDIENESFSISNGHNLNLGNLISFPFLTDGKTKLSSPTLINSKNIVYMELKNDSTLSVAYQNPSSLGITYYTLSDSDTNYYHLNDYAPMFYFFPKSQIGKEGYNTIFFNLLYYGEVKSVLTPIKNIPSAKTSLSLYIENSKTIYFNITKSDVYSTIYDFINTFTPAP